MKSWRTRAFGAALLAGAAALAIGIPAQGQDHPESLLPPGFGDAPTAVPAPAAPAEPAGNQSESGAPVIALQPPPPEIGGNLADALGNDAFANEATQQAYELPDYARRPIDRVGAMDLSNGGFGADAFGNLSGALVTGLMRRLDAPIASRWLSIQLRRALLSNIPAPRGVAPADWVAERAWLLLRMGEADAARLLVQGVDIDRYSPKMYAVAVQTALATADPAGFCPVADMVESIDGQPAWPLARAICAGLSGEAATSSAIIDRSRLNGRDIDMLLAQKVAGAGSNGRRAINIEWDAVDKLTPWRFGLANAVAVQVPDRLYATVGPEYQAWLARTAMVPAEQRLDAARVAAALGVFSNASLVDLYSQAADRTDPYALDQSPPGYLRAAYVADGPGARVEAMRSLWKDPKSQRDLYGGMILTARAAARIAPADERAGDAAALIASMLSAGLDLPAARWAPVIARLDAAKADPAWSLLAVGVPGQVVDTSYARVAAYAKRAGEEGAPRARMLFAALAGLGRLSRPDAERLAQELGVPVGQQNSWTRLLDRAVAQRQPGAVVLLAAIGMQTGDWRGVPPAFLFHIVSALRESGQGAVARMIAAEAVTRL